MTSPTRTFVVAVMAAMLISTPAFAQADPDCVASGSQYGDCDQTDVTVVAPPEQPPATPPPGSGSEDEFGSIPDDLDIPAELSVGEVSAENAGPPLPPEYSSSVSTTEAPSAPSATSAPSVATVPSGEAETYRDAPGSTGAIPTLPDTGGSKWLLSVSGVSMLALAFVIRKLLISS